MKKFLFILLMIFPLMLFAKSDEGNSEIIDQDVIVMPTASTIKNHRGTFGSYELIYTKIGFSIAKKTDIKIYAGVPFIRDMFSSTLTLGIKQNYYDSDYYKGAVIGLYHFKSQSGIIGAVSSFGFQTISFHMSGIYIKSFKKNSTSSLLLASIGMINSLSKKVSLLAEFDLYSNKKNDEHNNIHLLGFGLRIKSKSIIWDFGGVRPLGFNSTTFLFLPFVKVILYF